MTVEIRELEAGAKKRPIRRQILDGAALCGAQLARAKFVRVRLRGADLRGASLDGAVLENVDLSGANLDGASLRGARMVGVRMVGGQLGGVDARGAWIESSEFRDITGEGLDLSGSALHAVTLAKCALPGLRLDAASLRKVNAAELSWTSGSAVAVRASECAFRGCRLAEVDLRAAAFSEVELNGVTFFGCQLDGSSVSRSTLRAIEHSGGSVLHLRIDRCSGLDRGLEAALVQAGAVVRLGLARQLARRILEDPWLRKGVFLGAVVAAAALTAVTANPSLQPTLALQLRLAALPLDTDETACKSVIALGAPLLERAERLGPDEADLVERLVRCYQFAGQPDLAQAAIRAALDRPAPDANVLARVLLALGMSELAAGDTPGAEATLGRLSGLDVAPVSRLAVLRFEAAILLNKRGPPSPIAPGSPPSDPWRDLVLRVVAVLAEMPEPRSVWLDRTAEDLFVLGEWERADALLASCRELDASAAWSHVRGGADQLVALDRSDLALALMRAQRTDGGIDTPREIESLAVELQLLQATGLPNEALAVLEMAAAQVDATYRCHAETMRGSLALAAGRPDEAMAAVADCPLDPAWSKEQLSRYGWLRADAYLALERHDEAVESLFPLLAAVSDHAEGASLAERLFAWSVKLPDPGAVRRLIERAANPHMPAGSNLGQQVISQLRLLAAANSLGCDDPQYLGLLGNGAEAEALEGLALVLQHAEAPARGEFECVLAPLRSLPDHGRSQRGLLAVAWHARGLGAPAALAVLEAHALDQSSDPEVRRRALELAVQLNVELGQIDSALKRFRQLVELAPAGHDESLRAAAWPLVDALQHAGNWSEAESVLAPLVAQGAPDPDLLRESLTGLAGSRDERRFEAALTAGIRALGACAAETAATQARMDARIPPNNPASLQERCASAPSEQRARAAAVLVRAGLPGAAASLLASIDLRGATDDFAATVLGELAAAHALAGDAPRGFTLLNAQYNRAATEPWHRRITWALIGLGGVATGEQLVAAYGRYAGNHPGSVDYPLWELAAASLQSRGLESRIPDLAGTDAWQATFTSAGSTRGVQALIDAGNWDGAWTRWDVVAASAPNPAKTAELVFQAERLGAASGQHDRVLAALERLEGAAPKGSGVAARRELVLARTLGQLERHHDARERLSGALAGGVTADTKAEFLQLYGELIAAQPGSAHVAPALASLPIPMQKGPDDWLVRTAAARAALARQNGALALELLETLAGGSPNAEQSNQLYPVLVPAYIGARSAAGVLELPARFGGDPCAAWLAIVQHVPADDPAAPTALAKAQATCSPATISVEGALQVSQALARSEPAAALEFLRGVAGNANQWPVDRDRIELQRARLLVQSGNLAGGIAAMRKLASGPNPSGTLDACVELARTLASRAGSSSPVAEAEAETERCLVLFPDNADARTAILSAVVDGFRGTGMSAQAIAWQRRLVELQATPGERRAQALQQLAALELDLDPAKPPDSRTGWNGRVSEALAMVPNKGPLRDSLLVFALAFDVQATADPTRIERARRARLGEAEQPQVVTDQAATILDRWGRGESGAALRSAAGK